MNSFTAHSDFQSSSVLAEEIENGKELNMICMTISMQGNVCGISYSTPSQGILHCVPDFETDLDFKEIFNVIDEVSPNIVIGTESMLRNLAHILSSFNLETYIINKNSLGYNICRQRLGLVKLPYAPAFIDGDENAAFVFSNLPNNSTEMIKSAGALLEYFSKRLSSIELFPNERSNSILDIQVHNRKKYVFMDKQTLIRLQVFDSSFQDSLFRRDSLNQAQISTSLILFDYLNNCSTTLGSKLLSKWMRCPLRDENVLKQRLDAVEILCSPSNRELLKSLRMMLKRVSNLQRIMTKMQTSSASPNEWKNLLQSLQSLKELLGACPPNSPISPVILTIDSEDPCPSRMISLILEKIVTTIDIAMTSSHKRFIVKQGKQNWLDEWKQIYRCLPDILSRLAEHELNKLRGHVDACGLIYFPLVGYLLQVPSAQATETLQELGLQFIFENGDLTYYRTETTKELDKRYGDVMYAILDAETSIMHDLQEEILKNTKLLLRLQTFAAELDCLCALAMASIQMNGSRPHLTSDGQDNSVRIRKGRHVLYETLHPNYLANSFASSARRKNVTLVSGPNASGKTMYLKQIGLIIYLAHIGSFVPADSATIPLMDAILAWFPGDLGATIISPKFLVDVNWLSMALKMCSPRSFLLLDEFPHFNDKLPRKALFLGLLEYFHNIESPHVMITGLDIRWAKDLLLPISDGINFKQLRIGKDKNGPVFMHEITTGFSEKNYALIVAVSAGIPEEIVVNATATEKMQCLKYYEQKQQYIRRGELLKKMGEMNLVDFNNDTKTFLQKCLNI